MATRYSRFALVVGSAIVAVALAGCSPAGTSSGADPTAPPVSGSSQAANPADVMFAQMMIPHHAQAVQMGELAASRAADPGVRTIAATIAGQQSDEIDLMRGWLAGWGAAELDEQTAAGHASHMAGMLTAEQLDQLAATDGADFDRLYVEYMIEHHQGAVAMAETALMSGADPRVRAFAEDVISVQQAEIAQLQQLQATLG